MDQVSYFQALLLIQASGAIIAKRRAMESMCSYPVEYGGDEELLKSINTFLSNSYVKLELKEAIEFVKHFKEKT
jgi:hypothetical protein